MQSHQLKTSIGLTDLGRGQGGGGGCSGATQRSGLKKIGSRPSFGQLQFLTVRSAQYPHFVLFGRANSHILTSIHISVRFIWPLPTFPSIWSHQYAHFNLFGLANTHIQGIDVPPKEAPVLYKLCKCVLH